MRSCLSGQFTDSSTSVCFLASSQILPAWGFVLIVLQGDFQIYQGQLHASPVPLGRTQSQVAHLSAPYVNQEAIRIQLDQLKHVTAARLESLQISLECQVAWIALWGVLQERLGSRFVPSAMWVHLVIFQH
jgi:hypothetical protein